ncbi:HIT family protein [Congregibacter variabilis]|uniref:HIT family protein n=1 Tax=Congregibacter variabilis TaxID=3081200 RepID=A0ABZ0HZ85_9GAMM|nr:HIT family protein [Congregibacter sp. IMCC43200]
MSTSKQWQLHPTLAKDCHRVRTSSSAELLLHRNAALHWFILVPHTDSIDLLDLPADEREGLLSEASRINHYLKETFAYPRVNVGALGLVVPQLHLHVIGRREGDPCWPAPVWGNLEMSAEYSSAQVDQVRADLAE